MTNNIKIGKRKNNKELPKLYKKDNCNGKLKNKSSLENILEESQNIFTKTSDKKSYLSEQAGYIIELMLAKIFGLNEEKTNKLKAGYEL